jgi:hypothetical protein
MMDAERDRDRGGRRVVPQLEQQKEEGQCDSFLRVEQVASPSALVSESFARIRPGVVIASKANSPLLLVLAAGAVCAVTGRNAWSMQSARAHANEVEVVARAWFTTKRCMFADMAFQATRTSATYERRHHGVGCGSDARYRRAMTPKIDLQHEHEREGTGGVWGPSTYYSSCS